MPPVLQAQLGPCARGVFTTRAGGVSRGDWAAADGSGGCNLARHVADDPEAVTANRRRVEEMLGRTTIWMDQHHSVEVAVLSELPAEASAGSVDAAILVGDLDGALGVLVADCVPLLLAAADQPAVAAVHVGRAGLVGGIVPAVIEEFARLGVSPEALYASLGPSICGHCYEVPEAMRAQVAGEVPRTATTTSWGTPAIDIAGGVIGQLEAAGVLRIHHVGVCTRTDDRFYSYRRAAQTGRFSGIVTFAGYDTPSSWRPTASRLV